jgi:hypothetical protein
MQNSSARESAWSKPEQYTLGPEPQVTASTLLVVLGKNLFGVTVFFTQKPHGLWHLAVRTFSLCCKGNTS